MPPLTGFDANNPLRTHSEVTDALHALLDPLRPHFSPALARISLPTNTGTHFDRSAAELEGFARPLWGVGALIACASAQTAAQSSIPATLSGDVSETHTAKANTAMGDEAAIPHPTNAESRVLSELISPWREGLAAGTDPDHHEYWGTIQNTDQRMVEVEIIAFALLSAPETFYHSYPTAIQANIRTWLLGMNGKPMPDSNWRWFRIMSNLALIQVCSVDENEVRQQMDKDFECLEAMVLSDGWSADGPWLTSEDQERDEIDMQETGRADKVGRGRQADYYSGSFAIQFSQLVYCRFARDWDAERCQVHDQRAREFGAQFWRYFDEDGAAIPFGRSLTYRFACGAFFSALAFADVPNMPAPLDSPGAIKGFLLRHLRWWARNSSDSFHPDGTMNIGYLFPNMYMSEDYNSPQSPYWCLKTFLAISLPPTSSFWQCEEVAYPSSEPRMPTMEPLTPTLLQSPGHILINSPFHTYLLNATQFCAWPLKATQAKYSKFAYSSAFGFSVPTGSTCLAQLAPDNTLLLSRDGAETWGQKWKSKGTVLSYVRIGKDGGESVPRMTSIWYPWTDKTVEVKTTLVPPCEAWRDWHVRIHRVRIQTGVLRKPARVLLCVEGGFTISGRDAEGEVLPTLITTDFTDAAKITYGTFEGEESALIISPAGASGIINLPPTNLTALISDESHKVQVTSKAGILKPDANTNLMTQRTLIPTIETSISCSGEHVTEVLLITGVFAIARGGGRSVWERWNDRPVLAYERRDLVYDTT